MSQRGRTSPWAWRLTAIASLWVLMPIYLIIAGALSTQQATAWHSSSSQASASTTTP